MGVKTIVVLSLLAILDREAAAAAMDGDFDPEGPSLGESGKLIQKASIDGLCADRHIRQAADLFIQSASEVESFTQLMGLVETFERFRSLLQTTITETDNQE